MRYRELNSGSQKYNTLTVTELDLEVYDVGGLSKFTQYEFFITPFYRSVDGMPSNSKIVQTLEDGKEIDNFYVKKSILILLMYSNSSNGITRKRSGRHAKFNVGRRQMDTAATARSQWHLARLQNSS